jgi:non-ribosomal peptide synthetase-like protein
MGAKVGPGCVLDTAHCSSWDLVSIGEGSSIGADTQLPGYRIEDGMLILGEVSIGRRCFIGIHSALGIGVSMGDDSRLDDQSLLPDTESIPAGESRRGSPAQHAPVPVPEARGAAWKRPVLFGLAQLAALEALGAALTLPAVPFLAWWRLAYPLGLQAQVAYLALGVPCGFVALALWIAVLKRLILSRAEAGTYRVESFFYLRKWLSDSLMRISRTLLLPLYTTLYFPPWLRLLGARIGERAELSTVWNFAPELVDVGAESFFADGSIIGGKRFFGGSFEISRNRIGRRSFVGNSAILPVGASLGDECLLGVKSIPPAEPRQTPDGTEWLGSPAFSLPHRPRVGNFDPSVTFRPTPRLYLERGVIDGLRILIPGYVTVASVALGVAALYFARERWGTVSLFALWPAAGIAMGLLSILSVVALKWAVMGRFKPVIQPLWSRYVWLNEMVNGAYESLMAPAISQYLGTPLAPVFLRWLGCRIGRNTLILTTLFSEFDLVEIGDYATLGSGAVIQNHLFEDRVMKSSSLSIGDECTVGNMAVVLYDSKMLAGASLSTLSLLMKGETLSPEGRWLGIPTAQVGTEGAAEALARQSLEFHGARPGLKRGRSLPEVVAQPG